MTANEQADNLLFLLNRVNAGASFSYKDIQLSQALNTAQWHYIKMFVESANNMHQTSFEETEARGQGLSNLIKEARELLEVDLSSMYPDSRQYQLPGDFMLTLDEYITITTDKCEDVSCFISTVTHDEYARGIKNTYRKPKISGIDGRVWRMYRETSIAQDITALPDGSRPAEASVNNTGIYGTHELILPEGTTGVKYSIRYLKLPATIVVDKVNSDNQVSCELDEQVHQTITEIARDILLDTVKEQKIMSLPDIETYE